MRKLIFFFFATIAFFFIFSFFAPRTALACTPGQRQCLSSCTYQVCQTNGTWGTIQTCAPNSACVFSSTVGGSCQSSAGACGGTPPSGGSCSPEGAQQCTGSTTYKQCTNGSWVTHDCTTAGSGYYCAVVGTNDVSCVKGCRERGLTCAQKTLCNSANDGTPYPTYYCGSDPNIVCCSFATTGTTTKYACLSGTCQPSATGTFTEPTCGGTCAPQTGTGYEGQCPVCPSLYSYNRYATEENKKCQLYRDSLNNYEGGYLYSSPTYETCSGGTQCFRGSGCRFDYSSGAGFTSGQLPCSDKDGNFIGCNTALGPFSASPQAIIKNIFAIILSIAGALAVILIIISGYRLTTSQGNPEAIQNAREQLTAAIVGLLFVIFSFTILRFIGIDLLNLTGQY